MSKIDPEHRIREIVDEMLAALPPKGATRPMGVKCGEGVYLVAFESRDPAWVFVPDPCRRGRFCRVPRSFLFNACPVCHALPGQPCHNPNRGTSWSGLTGHADRNCEYTGKPFPYSRTHLPPTTGKHNDRIHDAAEEALGIAAQSPGYEFQAVHLPGCDSLTRKKNPICNCNHADRVTKLKKIKQQLPRVNQR